MPLYRYKAQNIKGEIVEDTVQANSKLEAANALKADGMQVLTIKGLQNKGTSILGGKISVAEKAAFCRFMGVMLRAGLSIPEAVEIIREETKNKKMQRILSEISSETRKGKTISSVVTQYKDDFDSVFLTMIQAGEESGTLEKSFDYLAKQLADNYELSQKVKSSLMYPAVIFIAMGGVGILMVTFVLPRIAEVFTKMDIELPTFTRMIMQVGVFVGGNIPLVLGGAVVMGIIAFMLFYIQKTRNIIMGFITRMPGARSVVKQIDTARFANTLSTLLKSGVPIMEALNVAAAGLSQRAAREEAKSFSEEIARGESLSSVLVKTKHIFPPTVVQTVKAGEKTGSLEEVLAELSDFYEKEVDHSLKRFTSLLEPALMLVVGVAVGAMVVMMVAPIYSIVGGLQQSVQ